MAGNEILKTTLNMDFGYGDVKVLFDTKEFKFSSAVSAESVAFTDFGNNEVYTFEDKNYFIGQEAEINSYTSRNYDYLYKYSPLMVYKALELGGVNFKNVKSVELNLNTGLSISDWDKKEDFKYRLKNFEVNNIKFNCKVRLFAQGEGIYREFINKIGEIPNIAMVVDVGFNTIDVLVFKNGKPSKQHSFAFAQAGISKVIKQLKSYLDGKYKFNFPEMQVKEIFLDKKMKYQGELDEKVPFLIEEIKTEYINWLKNELLTQNIEITNIADYVILGGGGTYYLDGIVLPKNYVFSTFPYEYSNVVGYSLT